MKKIIYYVYILECADGTYYTGCTSDLNRRVYEHNSSKKGAHYTKLRRPVALRYHEDFSSLSLAAKREYELKQLTHTQKGKLCKTMDIPQ